MLAEFLLFGLGVVEAVQSLLSVPVFEAEREPVVGIVTVECGQGVAVSGGRIAPALAGGQATGNGALKLRFELPLGVAGGTTVAGEYAIASNQLRVPGVPVLSQVDGRIAFTVGDPARQSTAPVVTATSNNTAFLPNASLTIAGTNCTDRTLILPAPAANANGAATITV